MKKTRLVELLEDDFENLLPEVVEGKISKKQLIEHFLSKCEIAGMLPPTVTCPVLLRKENKWED